MKIKLIDTQTEHTKEFDTEYRAFYWAEGNGSCDCNRFRYFPGVAEEMDKAQRIEFPELEEHFSYCHRGERILIIAIESNEYSLDEFNSGYPETLKQQYLPQPNKSLHQDDNDRRSIKTQ